jgi:dolichyl-diphosphooligosaccharide---protein glycosyltransferase
MSSKRHNAKKKPAAVAASPGVLTNSSTSMAPASNNSSTFANSTGVVAAAVALQLLFKACQAAYHIRMYAIVEFGRVIHEFDPYFNYRATEYLYANGWRRFSTWFDYAVWYPLGRPVGTTIYPGMQVTAVLLKNYVLKDWSINDICCFIPAWFGVAATLSVAWMAYEATRAATSPQIGTALRDVPVVAQLYHFIIRPLVAFLMKHVEAFLGGPASVGWRLYNTNNNNNNNAATTTHDYWWTSPVACATAAAGIMSIVPAHLLRSVAGGYDNESIAMTAMVVTFAMWMTALRDGYQLRTTALLGVATGLAYFYMVAAWGGYVFVLNLVGLHAAFLVLVGRYSTKLHRAYSLFYLVGTALAIQVPVVGWTPLKSIEQMGPLLVFGGIQLIEYCQIMKRRHRLNTRETWIVRAKVFGASAIIAAVVIFILVNAGYFGPISSRVRGLFVKHTKTGNPLVDSVAEHQAASSQAYYQYLHKVCYVMPVGMALVLLTGWNDSSSFLLVYGVAAYYFSHRMVRLILLTAPIASALGGIAIGRVMAWGALNAILIWDPPEQAAAKKSTVAKAMPFVTRSCRLLLTAFAIYYSKPHVEEFHTLCHDIAKQISHPTIIQKARTHNGQEVIVDDYREAYWWLRDYTPEDSRIMAWWDYGYQISGISNRTTIADGNTWNHEHIALLGRVLTGPEKEAHRIARHLADYVLVWAGGGGDDVAKSPHLRRIANSVYRGLCREPTCRDFGFSVRCLSNAKLCD